MFQSITDKYQVLYSKGSKKDLEKLPRIAQVKIAKRITQLIYPFHATQAKALMKHETAMYRIRVGDYRVLYDIYSDDKVILIVKIGHRKDVYRLIEIVNQESSSGC